MAHRHEHLCSASQLWLPHPALCVVPPECFWGLCVWSGAVGSKSGKLRNVVDRDNTLLNHIQCEEHQRVKMHPERSKSQCLHYHLQSPPHPYMSCLSPPTPST